MPALTILLGPMQRLILESSVPPKVDEPSDYEVDAERPIFAEIKARDADAAERAMKEHFGFMSDERYRRRFGRPFRGPVAAAEVAQADGDHRQRE